MSYRVLMNIHVGNRDPTDANGKTIKNPAPKNPKSTN